MSKAKHVVCYSGGHSSALVAIEVVRKFGRDGVVLLNHNISPEVECQDVKRFKREVADYLGLPITYANIGGVTDETEIPNQFEVCESIGAFKVRNGFELCTNRLKTGPFQEWLEKFADSSTVIYYGFDMDEQHRITRRATILGAQGYRSDYPLALWDRSIESTREVGIEPPMQYSQFKHANCVGCLKAGKQHWYVVYCTRRDIFERAKLAEERIGYSIIRDAYLEELEPVFKDMELKGIEPTELTTSQRFWADVRKAGIDTSTDVDRIPCECIF